MRPRSKGALATPCRGREAQPRAAEKDTLAVILKRLTTRPKREREEEREKCPQSDHCQMEIEIVVGAESREMGQMAIKSDQVW